MIKALTNNGDVIVGLSRKNCEKLLEGKPIILQLSDMGRPPQIVILCAGETEEALMRELVTHLGVENGAKVHTMVGDGFPPEGKH